MDELTTCDVCGRPKAEGVWTITGPDAQTSVVALCDKHTGPMLALHERGKIPPQLRERLISEKTPKGSRRRKFALDE